MTWHLAYSQQLAILLSLLLDEDLVISHCLHSRIRARRLAESCGPVVGLIVAVATGITR
jgi:hypothetical protein